MQEYKVEYFTISQESIMLIISGQRLPKIIFNNDYRYPILKDFLTNNKLPTIIDQSVFNKDALINHPNLVISDFGTVKYKKGSTLVGNIPSKILSNLVEYYGTPIYDTYSKYVDELRLYESDDYAVEKSVIQVSYIDKDTSQIGLDTNSSLCSLGNVPYIVIDSEATFSLFKDALLGDSTNDFYEGYINWVNENVKIIEQLLLEAVKCSVTDLDKLSDFIKTNNNVLSKVMNALSDKFTINDDCINYITKNWNNTKKLTSLITTRMMVPKA